METGAEQSSLLEYAQIIWARRWTVIAVTVAAGIISLIYSAAATKEYEATSDMLLTQPLPSTLVQATNPQSGQVVVDVPTQIQVIESATVADMVKKSIGSAPPLSVAQIGTTDVVALTAKATSAKLAQTAADAYAHAYIRLEHEQTAQSLQAASQALQQRLTSVQAAISSVDAEASHANPNAYGVQAELGSEQSSLELEESTLANQLATYQLYVSNQQFESGQLLTPAPLPTKAASPKPAEYAVLALLLGLVLGLALALVLRFFESASTDRHHGVPAHGSRVQAGWRPNHHDSSSLPESQPADGREPPRPVPARAGLDLD
jgi:uncharacterized protein involved in exopolysaccharide biosynthesis